jgi:hypothetical protein
MQKPADSDQARLFDLTLPSGGPAVTGVTPLLRLCYAWMIKKPRFYAGCYGVTALDPQIHSLPLCLLGWAIAR